MSDCFPGDITIGGKIPEHLLDELIISITTECSTKDWSDLWTKEELQKAFRTDDFIKVCDDQARYGEIQTVKEFLIKNQIPFDMHSDAFSEFDAVNTYYRNINGKYEEISFLSTQDGNDLIPLDNIQKIVENGKLDEEQKVDEFRKILAERTKLPKIEIVDVHP